MKVLDQLFVSERPFQSATASANATASKRLKRIRRRFGKSDAALLRALYNRGGQRMFASALERCGQAQQFVLIESLAACWPFRRNDGAQLRLSFGERAGLVDHQRV